MQTVVCMKWGTKYEAYYVNKLYAPAAASSERMAADVSPFAV